MLVVICGAAEMPPLDQRLGNQERHGPAQPSRNLQFLGCSRARWPVYTGGVKHIDEYAEENKG